MITAVILHTVCYNMKADEVTRAIDSALERASLDKNNRPRLLSDNGSY